MRRVLTISIVILLLGAAAFVWRIAPRALTVTEGRFPEELVYVRSSDDVVNGGVMFKTIGTMKALPRGDPLTESPLSASRTDVRAQPQLQYKRMISPGRTA